MVDMDSDTKKKAVPHINGVPPAVQYRESLWVDTGHNTGANGTPTLADGKP